MVDFFCIYKKDDSRSEAFLAQTTDSAKKFLINVIPFEGVYTNLDKQLKKHELKINPLGEHKIKTNGVIGCFLSHFKLWNKCLELNRPIGILEYDAVFVRPLPNNILDNFTHYLNLDFSRHLYLDSKEVDYTDFVLNDTRAISIEPLKETNVESKIRKPFKYINNNHIKGAFGYIIKPEGARRLVDASLNYGILPADIQPNLMYCHMHYIVPSVVMLNEQSLIDRVKYSHTAIDKIF
jgi:glycosyl transferase family 25